MGRVNKWVDLEGYEHSDVSVVTIPWSVFPVLAS